MVRTNGCAYGKVTRNMIENLITSFEDFKKETRIGLKEISDGQKELFNHQSSRLPLWVTIFLTAGGSLIAGLIVLILTR